jgi:hypothetical protein
MKKQTLKKLALATGVAAAIAAPVSQASIIDHPFFRVLGVVIVWGTDTATGTKAIASDFVLMTGASNSAGTDLIAANGRAVITGSLSGAPASEAAGSMMSIKDPTSGGVLTDNGTSGYLDAADVMTAFELDNNTDVDLSTSQVQHSFYVASNTAFDIQAVASNFNVTGDFGIGPTALTLADIGYSLAVNAAGATDGAITWGAAAQDPSTGGTGVIAAIDSLDDISTSQYVFDGGQKTASTTGTIASQSVRFDATYTLGAAAGYDLSMGAGVIEADVTYTVFVP